MRITDTSIWPRRALAAALALSLVAPAGCQDPAEVVRARPVAQAAIDVRTLAAPSPAPGFDAECEPGASIVLLATGSYDPAGQPLDYEWRDVVEGSLSPDFTPRANPFRTSDVEVPAYLFTIGVHDITLTVTTRDGRKATAALRVAVVPCGTCGG